MRYALCREPYTLYLEPFSLIYILMDVPSFSFQPPYFKICENLRKSVSQKKSVYYADYASIAQIVAWMRGTPIKL